MSETDDTRSREQETRFDRITKAAIEAIKAHPDYGDDLQITVLVDTDEFGIADFHGYPEDRAAGRVRALRNLAEHLNHIAGVRLITLGNCRSRRARRG